MTTNNHSRPSLQKILMVIFLLLLAGTAIGVIRVSSSHQKTSLPQKEVCCQEKNAPYHNPNLSIDERVSDLLGRMTEREKIGQLALVEKNGLGSVDDIREYHLGALLGGAGSRPTTNTPGDWLAMVKGYQTKAKETRLGIPLLYGIDAIHGVGGVQGATIFPHAIGLAASHDSELVKRIAEATTAEMAATGMYWNFAPSLDVPKDIRWGRVYETFGSNTKTVSELGSAYLQGIQTTENGYLKAIGTPKHFIGAGAMDWGTSGNSDYKIDQGNVTLNETTLRKEHLEPFKQAIDHGALVIMAGLNRWNGKKLSADSHLLTDVLKKELGFQGFVVSDWYGVYAISEDRYQAVVRGINAGVDMIMLPFDYQEFTSTTERALAAGDISQTRLDDAVRRILTVKFKLGLFDRPEAQLEGLLIIGSAEHRAIAREAVQKSQTLLKNSHKILPLSRTTSNILVAGSAAHNLGRQAGAWTIEWQGIDGNGIRGTTVLDGIKQTVSSSTRVDYDAQGNFVSGTPMADVGIAVVGEKPYAEGVGDDPHPKLSEEDLATIRRLRAKCEKLVVVIISGRPLDLSSQARDWDAIVAAWLPGSEGKGIADPLFGVTPFTSKLPIPWTL